jgi:two-component system, cell cycle sensor histidine kinase and response regulator CckA
VKGDSRYRLFFEHNPSPMWVYDVDTLEFIEVNDAAVAQYGFSREEFARMTLRDLRPPDERPRLEEMLGGINQSDEAVHIVRHRRKDGSLLDVEARGRPIPLPGRQARLVIATDISARRVLEEQLRQSQKMEAVGRLAAGIAHDFNNILTVITSYSEMLRSDLQRSRETRELNEVEEIIAAAGRAGALTRQLLAFGRKQIVRPRAIDVSETLAALEPMLRRLIPDNVQFETALRSDVGDVLADPTELEQVAMNLVINAVDAMPNGGTLVLETTEARLDDQYADTHAGVAPGKYVMMAVTDTGIGMDVSTTAMIFEPFFTTKPQGHGTGLGLSTVYGIVTQLGGHIRVYSEPGQGASFKIYLPVMTTGAMTTDRNLPDDTLVSGSGTVLLVDDEEPVRRAIRQMLERLGYSVLDAPSGGAGLSIARRHAGPIDVAVSDLTMPGIDGRNFADAFLLLHPQAHVVFTSGYTDDAVVRRGLVDSRRTFLQKPFTIAQLSAALAQATASSGS